MLPDSKVSMFLHTFVIPANVISVTHRQNNTYPISMIDM